MRHATPTTLVESSQRWTKETGGWTKGISPDMCCGSTRPLFSALVPAWESCIHGSFTKSWFMVCRTALQGVRVGGGGVWGGGEKGERSGGGEREGGVGEQGQGNHTVALS